MLPRIYATTFRKPSILCRRSGRVEHTALWHSNGSRLVCLCNRTTFSNSVLLYTINYFRAALNVRRLCRDFVDILRRRLINFHIIIIITPSPHKAEASSVDGRRLSVCLFVCPVPDRKSRMEKLSKLKIGNKEDHSTGHPWTHLDIETSKVKVTRSQVKTASVPKRRQQLLAPPVEHVYNYRCEVSIIKLIHRANTYSCIFTLRANISSSL